MRIGINGRFYGAPPTGVQRVAREVSSGIFARADTMLLLPATARRPDVPPHVRLAHGRLTGVAWEQIELPHLARSSGCDVVLHLANTGPGWGGPHVLLVHDVLPLTAPGWFSPAFARWYRLSMARAARRAAMVLAASGWTRNEVLRVLDLDPGRVRVMPQGTAPFDHPSPPEEVARARSRFRLDEPYILVVGAGDPRKNAGFLTEVLGEWRERQGTPLIAALVGEGNQRVHGEVVRPAGANMRSLGRVDDDELRALYTGAVALCAPSFAEGFGRPALEALGCGTPAIVANYGPAAEVLGDAAAILPLEPVAWVGAIAVAQRPDDRLRLAGQGRKHAARFRWEDAADTVIEACEAAARHVPVAVS